MYSHSMLARHYLHHILPCSHQRDQFACFQDWTHICIHNKLKINLKKRIGSIQATIQWYKRFDNKINDVTTHMSQWVSDECHTKYDFLTSVRKKYLDSSRLRSNILTKRQSNIFTHPINTQPKITKPGIGPN